MSDKDVSIDAEVQAQIERARQAGIQLDKSEPSAIKAWYEPADELVFIKLNTGIVMGFPYKLLQGLEEAVEEQLAEVEVTSTGYGLHWESLDVDLGVPQLIAGLFGTKRWMAELGRKGGAVKSKVKTKASQENGKLGGRPRKSKFNI